MRLCEWQKPTTRTRTTKKRTSPPALTTRPHPLFSPFFLFLLFLSAKTKTKNKKQWAKVASVPIERMRAIKEAFLDEVKER